MKEHRRIDVSGGGGSYAGDADFIATSTLPTLGSDLAAGEIAEFVTFTGAVTFFCELRDGMSDSAGQVAAGSFTYSAEVILMSRAQGEDVLAERSAAVDVAQQAEQVEFDMPKRPAFIRVSAAANLGAAAAIWVYVDTSAKAAG